MKETIKAFPVPSYVNVAGETHDSSIQGMDLRDYFAAKALQGFLANPETAPNEVNVIAACWGIANAMINERNKNASEKAQ